MFSQIGPLATLRSRRYAPVRGVPHQGYRWQASHLSGACSSKRLKIASGEMVGFHAGEGVGFKLVKLDAMIPPEDFQVDQVGSASSRRAGQVPAGEGPLPHPAGTVMS
jgi:hypothetical protein